MTKEVIVLVSVLSVAGCGESAQFSTPALDPEELALSAPSAYGEAAPRVAEQAAR